ncbi:MAG TPA: phosphotransferase, partial [Micavibrio sp.]
MSQALPKIQDWFDARAHVRDAFLKRTGWDTAQMSAVGEDSAFRRYFRLKAASGRTAILMEAVPDGSAYVTPGHNMKDFIRISQYLRGLGLCAPDIFESDLEDGYLLLDDFGSTSFKMALDAGTDRDELYALATDVLKFLRENAKAGDIVLPEYYASHVHTGRRRLVDWFMPAQRGHVNPDGLAEEYLAVWDSIEQSLAPVPQGFL